MSYGTYFQICGPEYEKSIFSKFVRMGQR